MLFFFRIEEEAIQKLINEAALPEINDPNSLEDLSDCDSGLEDYFSGSEEEEEADASDL